MFIHSYRRSVISSVQMYQVYSISLSASTEVQQKWGFPCGYDMPYSFLTSGYSVFMDSSL